MDKDLKILVERLERIFPYMKMEQYNEEESYNMEADYAIPFKLDWFNVIEILQKNGLKISNIK